MSFEYENAQEHARRSPHTFHVPTADQLASIGPGDCVKICAAGIPGATFAERFWILVHRVDGDTITGEVSNLLYFHPLQPGDLVTVKRANVYDIDPAGPKQ